MIKAPFYSEATLKARLQWLIFFRLLMAVLGIAAILIFEAKWALIPQKYKAAYYTLVAACGINLVYMLLSRSTLSLRSQALCQICGDIVLETALVYFSGIDRVFAYLYFATIVASAMSVGPRASYFFASCATILLSAVSLGYFFANQSGFTFSLPLVNLSIQKEYIAQLNFLLPYLFFFALSLHIVALLANRLAEETRRTRIVNQEILENMADGVLTIDKERKIVFMNEQAKNLLRLDKNQKYEGELYQEWLPPSLKSSIDEVFQTQKRSVQELALHERTLDVVITMLYQRANEPRGTIVILHDISHRRQMDAMQKREEQLKTLVDLSASVTHEVRNPLASIRGAAQELKEQHYSASERAKLAAIIVKETDRLNKILTDFLELSTDKTRENIPIDMKNLLQEMVSLLRTCEGGKNVVIELECPYGLTAHGNPNWLKQAFMNIGINSLQAIEAGGKINIRAGIKKDKAASSLPKQEPILWIEFRDNGIGIAPQHLDKIFDPFFTTKARGTGLGLAIARKIIHAHGGDIAIESKERQGTRCLITLPHSS